MIDVSTLNKGDWLKVKFASDRTQNAVFHGTDRAGNLKVRKWLATSKRMTGVVRIKPSDVLYKMDHSPIKGEDYR